MTAQRAAPGKTTERQPRAAEGPVGLQCFEGVAGARRREPARRRSSGHGVLICTNRAGHHSNKDGHVNVNSVTSPAGCAAASSRSTASASSENVKLVESGRQMKRYVDAGIRDAASRIRSTSRSRRRTRFRWTAVPTDRPTAYATRVVEASESWDTIMARGPDCTRRPDARRWWISRADPSETITRSGVAGPSHAGNAGSDAPRDPTCADGNHGGALADGCWAETSSSSRPPRPTRAELRPRTLRVGATLERRPTGEQLTTGTLSSARHSPRSLRFEL